MFSRLFEFLKKKEFLLQREEPLFYDASIFLKEKIPVLSRHIIPLTFKQGTFVFGVKSSGALQEFFFIKNELFHFLRDKKHPIQEITTKFIGTKNIIER